MYGLLIFMIIAAHIFFDDAFEISDHSDDDIQVNRFVKLLVTTIDEAASDVQKYPARKFN
jgi:hypothetical protein